jgi:hypothetical protein
MASNRRLLTLSARRVATARSPDPVAHGIDARTTRASIGSDWHGIWELEAPQVYRGFEQGLQRRTSVFW